MVTTRQIELVQATWRMLEPTADDAAALFYDRLFELDPMLVPLFPENLSGHRRRLTTMIGAAVWGLSDLDALVPVLRMLGQRQAEDGVTEEDRATVASALLWTLRKSLSATFTVEAAQAWTDVYRLLTTMLQAAAPEREAVAA